SEAARAAGTSQAALHAGGLKPTGQSPRTGNPTGSTGYPARLVRIVFIDLFLGGGQVYLDDHVIGVQQTHGARQKSPDCQRPMFHCFATSAKVLTIREVGLCHSVGPRPFSQPQFCVLTWFRQFAWETSFPAWTWRAAQFPRTTNQHIIA